MPFIALLIFIIIFLISVRFNKTGEIFNKPSTETIKGLFIFLIMSVHYAGIYGYFPYNGFLSEAFIYPLWCLGQLVVAPFFLISGYGVMNSFLLKGKEYSRTLITNGCLRLLIYGIFSLIPYFIIYTVRQVQNCVTDYRFERACLASFRGSNSWFLVALVLCYLLSFLTFLIRFKKKWLHIVVVSSALAVYTALFIIFAKEQCHYYDTILSFPIGMLLAYFKPQIEKILERKTFSITFLVISFLGVIINGIVLFKVSVNYYLFMVFGNIFLSIFILCLTKLFTVNSKILGYISKHSFGIYFMHMVPQLILFYFWDTGIYTIDFLLAMIFGFAVGIAFQYLYKLLDKYITNPIVKIQKQTS